MFGERLKLARKRSGLSLRALSSRINGIVSAQAIGKYERGEMMPSSNVAIALAEALGVSLSYLQPFERLLGVGRVQKADFDQGQGASSCGGRGARSCGPLSTSGGTPGAVRQQTGRTRRCPVFHQF